MAMAENPGKKRKTAESADSYTRDTSLRPDTPAGVDRPRKRSTKPERLVSLDAYRGFIMTMLAANGFGILEFSEIDESSPVWQSHNRGWWQNLAVHFDHPAWESITGLAGVSFWDLIQPAFMFMVGVSMPWSYASRANKGASMLGMGFHALIRSIVLVLMGVFLYSLGHDRTNWIFPNVLAQIGLGYFVAWILLNQKLSGQLTALVVLLVGYWALFFFNPPPANHDFSRYHADPANGEVYTGKYAPWSKNGNAAFFFDQWLLPKLRSPKPVEPAQPTPETPVESPAPAAASVEEETGPPAANPEANVPGEPEAAPQKPGLLRQWFFSTTEEYEPNRGGYATLNFVPSIATALLGILCGQLLISTAVTSWRKLAILAAAALICLGLGVLMHQTICPVVKRIWTPSWVLFSGGYVIGLLALFYLLFDLLPLQILAFPLVVVGMNSILIYMIGQTIRGWTTRNVVRMHFSGFIESVFGPKALDPQWYGPLTDNTATFLVFWLFLFWLHRQRIFLRV